MASPHIAADMLQPFGMLTPALFPNLDEDGLETFLETLLADAYERVTANDQIDVEDRDGAAIAWSYHRAYLVIWQRLSATPAQAQMVGESGYQYTASQVETFKSLSDRYLEEYSGFVLPVAETTRAGEVRTHVPTKITF